jgi:CRISPR/Cas system-associated exonuclease Cas4 (RecB family)
MLILWVALKKEVIEMRHSYSSWSTYKQCPAKFKFSYIDKLPRGAVHPNAKRGTEIHKSVEDFINGSQPMLHAEINSEYGHWITSLKNNSECLPEPMWLINSDWELIDNEDRAWAKGFFDLQAVSEDKVEIYEWKTGKIYDEHIEQRFLYGLIALLKFPKYNTITVTNVYFDQKKKVAQEFKRENVNFMKDTWAKRFKKVESEQQFPPNPQFLCRYCSFSKQNGGPCQF